MQVPKVIATLRSALTNRGRVAVRVSLDSGACWVIAVKLDERRGVARVHADLAGARVVLGADRVLEVST